MHFFPTQLEFAWIFPIQLSSSQYLYSFEKSCGEGQLILFCSPFCIFDYETRGYNRLFLLYDFFAWNKNNSLENMLLPHLLTEDLLSAFHVRFNEI